MLMVPSSPLARFCGLATSSSVIQTTAPGLVDWGDLGGPRPLPCPGSSPPATVSAWVPCDVYPEHSPFIDLNSGTSVLACSFLLQLRP